MVLFQIIQEEGDLILIVIPFPQHPPLPPAATRQTSQISPDIQKMTGTSARESLRSAREKLLAALHCTNPGSNLALVHLGEDAAWNKQEIPVVAELSLQCPGYV